MSGVITFLIAISGIIALGFMLIPNAIGLYAIFALAYTQRERLTVHYPDHLLIRFVLTVLLSVGIMESLDWARYYYTGVAVPPLYHPQLIPNLLLAATIGVGWALAWYLVSRRYPFTLLQVFVIHGLYGVLTEENGAILAKGGENLPESAIFWGYTFLIYGAMMALAYLPYREVFAHIPFIFKTETENKASNDHQADPRQDSLLKYVIILPALYLMSRITYFVLGAILVFLNLLPDPASIFDRPYW